MDANAALQKGRLLVRRLRELDSLVVAFSGGLDSTLLLALAHEALGDRVIAATSCSLVHPRHEIESAKAFCRERGIRHILFESGEMESGTFRENSPERCYFCKKTIMQALLEIAEEQCMARVAHGANLDDLADHRPGARAAEEAGALAPLLEAGLGKSEIRLLSRAMGLPTWDRPSMACLATRIPYGSPITDQKLAMIESAESFILGQGIRVARVRHHGTLARIETGKDEIDRFLDPRLRTAVVEHLRTLGFSHVALDLEGYETGKMNRELEEVPEETKVRST